MELRRGEWIAVAIVLVSSIGAGNDERGEDSKSLGMSPAVACVSIDGYEDYQPLPHAALSSDEKLQVYYRPFGYQVEHTGPNYRVHLTQDGQIRRRGQKTVLQRKAKLVDFEFTSKEPSTPLYMRNSISMKGLKPGEYDLDIILHDEIGAGPTAMQVLPFQIVPPGPRAPEGEEGRSRDRSASP